MWHQLSQKQAKAFMQRIQPILRFLWLCRGRLDERGFDPQSPFYAAVAKAHDAVHGLHVERHYLSIKRGVGTATDEAPHDSKNEQ
jgi:hypothetical protein